MARHAPPDLYRALTLGTDVEREAAATEILVRRNRQAAAVVRRAISIVARRPSCRQLHPLTDVLEDCTLDDTTRAAAALALGTIARDFPCAFPGATAGVSCPSPHDPIPSWSQHTLEKCVVEYPVQVRRACAEALGHVSTRDVVLLRSLRDTASNDTMLRIFAGRALTRLTQAPEVAPESLDQLVRDAEMGVAP